MYVLYWHLYKMSKCFIAVQKHYILLCVCVHVCVCVCACVHVCVHVCVRAYMYGCVHICVYVCVCTCVCVMCVCVMCTCHSAPGEGGGSHHRPRPGGGDLWVL